MSNIQFPSLAFGGRNAPFDTSAKAMEERCKISNAGSSIYRPLAGIGEFMAQSLSTSINGLQIACIATTPVQIVLKKTLSPVLLIPIFGSGIYQHSNQDVAWLANATGALMPAGILTGETSLRSSLAICIDSDRLELTAATMLGVDKSRVPLFDLNVPRQVLLRNDGIAYDGILRQMTGSIDLLYQQPDLLHLSGIDESMYRVMTMLLKPELFKVQNSITRLHPNNKNLLDRACQYIQENQQELITLTDLERVSCMSKRNLHYAFRNRFNCTPMQWVRMQRLETARALLREIGSSANVTATAFLCGFSKSSTFSHYYNLRFGELPSTTIAHNH